MSNIDDRGGALLDALRELKTSIAEGDAKTLVRVTNAETAIARIEREQTTLAKSVGRERAFGGMAGAGNAEPDIEAARGLLKYKHAALHQKVDLRAEPHSWTTEQITESDPCGARRQEPVSRFID